MASMLANVTTMSVPKANCRTRGLSAASHLALRAPAVVERGMKSNLTISSALPTTVPTAKLAYSEDDLAARHADVLQYFPTAMGIDDFIGRTEVVLSGYGFTGDNSIAMTNLCRDEVTTVMKDKIEAVFGSSFNTNGLGGVLTCGATGMGAGLSHSPTCSAGRERYVFFSFPHIAIDGQGNVGAIARPGRAGRSCACGALQKCLNEFTAEGYSNACKVPGEHDPLDPEYSILKQRLARRLRYERADVTSLTLPSLTAVAERTITNDLEYLIEKAIDPTKADYAVITGVQIHNWATSLEEGGLPSMEFAAPTTVYVVVNGVKIPLDLGKVPAMSPRQLLMLASGQAQAGEPYAVAKGVGSTLQEIPYSYLAGRLGGASQIKTPEQAISSSYNSLGSWQSLLDSQAVSAYDKALGAANMELSPNTSFEVVKAV